MNGEIIRKKFLDYFKSRGHQVVRGASLVPADDPSLLFTNAGMVQFKKQFTGEEQTDYSRAASCQPCVRAGGKHNDLENVGYTARHHTFFEMLGNFSFGDYFKEEAINFAWDFLTRELGLSPENLWVSVFQDDDEAFAIWEKIEGLRPGRIVRMGEKDNFWAMGDTGPCGPCSEIHIDQGAAVPCDNPHCGVDCDCDRFLEIWNLVFMQFERSAEGKLSPLPKPSIDTGMGLERIAAVLQGKYNNYDSDLFQPIIRGICKLAGVAYGEDSKTDTALRVIADHARAASFLVADGVMPSNEGRGYVLRRIIRRAIRYGRTIGFERPFLAQVCRKVSELMGASYPQLNEGLGLMEKVLYNEEERFLETLDNGLNMLAQELERLRSESPTGGKPQLAGEFLFRLYDTYGLPVDIAKDISHEEGFSLDEAGFERAMSRQRQQSRQSWRGDGDKELAAGLKLLLEKGHITKFVGYETRRKKARCNALVNEQGELVSQAREGERIVLVCEESPFYAESGGQAGDQGEISGAHGRMLVNNTQKLGAGLVLHKGFVSEGFLDSGEMLMLAVGESRRQKIAANHTATHLLHAALKRLLGEHVRQAGSMVEPERLRFDFTHFSPLSREELVELERLVNAEIRADISLQTAMLARDEAISSGAAALFGEKYGETVRVVSVGEFSKELCGGTHVRATGEIGLFKIVSESGIAASTRRIEAVCGEEALLKMQRLEQDVLDLSKGLKASPGELLPKVEKLQERVKDLDRKLAQLAVKGAGVDLDGLVASAQLVAGNKLVAARVAVDSAKTLRELGDRLRDRMGEGWLALLGAEIDGKAALLALVSKDLQQRYRAGDIVKAAARQVDGSGGGRADMAQAGGSRPDKLDEALKLFVDQIGMSN